MECQGCISKHSQTRISDIFGWGGFLDRRVCCNVFVLFCASVLCFTCPLHLCRKRWRSFVKIVFTRILPEGSQEYSEPQEKIDVFADAAEEDEGVATEGDRSPGNKTQQDLSQRLRYEI